MRLHCWRKKIIRWFISTPRRSSDRAYEASKRLHSLILIYDSPLSVRVKSSLSTPDKLFRATTASTNTASNKSIYLIYCSLLEHRFSISILGMHRNLKLFFRAKLIRLLPVGCYRANNSLIRNCLNIFLPNLTNILLFQDLFFNSRQNCYMNSETVNRRSRKIVSFSEDKLGNDLTSRVSYRLSDIEKINRKLAWIEASSNEFVGRRTRRSINFFSFQITKKVIEKSLNYESENFSSAYESISLVPRSVTRTLSRFRAELTNQSSVLVRNDFDLTRNQASVSLQYVGCFLLLPLTIPISLRNWFLESWIRGWWNITQTQVFINPIQEEKALKQLRETEALLWLNDAIEHLVDRQLPNFDANAYDETTQLAAVYDELNIQLLLQLVTDVISIATPTLLFITGRKRLAVSNSRIQESFYSLNDTMKAFSILLLTDLCVGFHSPHGWEIVIGSLFEHFGLIPNRYVISRLVSTFPVILDTVSKYWIFRHLNRTSPSIVATYHTMSG
uniref:chloroplast envelope membrane protein n=1 Tax=Bolbitis tonkinensis TaxID=2605328 RepID=UPI0023AB4BE1|nr:chloroplast envelope membrane protein [Bolbitis tonkinensis]WCO86947.1 chloroplast envelope membrane protein [Bolbitis tonkinensis]